ncbi:MAG: FtsX-like permease family protein [Candidatus Aminicenantes bacterium]|nr:FtsX-like permease family protein [Candidatus Aminicenantes bacterium]NIM80829.1 FtsX-like permease family protein [Candidatus Aminicenantes bacterium]NIN20213.1 FtsX-like permease family protein [Candidatus Aminicenantes bacterium]NIN43992.1 FtsX-like permease family protein [Candidatus Aminicenantes bacterium]NIN86801.1 FtsX-like permease family protein [Candidatus Aminicenantes bacterium]
MFKNYLKIAFRNIIRQKGYSFINISGLAIGLACFILMLLLTLDELSFDRFHENADHIYRVFIENKDSDLPLIAVTPAPLAASLKKDFPGITEAACFNYGGGGLVKCDNKYFEESYFEFTDPSFFKMFSFTFIKGNPQTALEDPLSVVLSQKTAEKYFGQKDPLGKTLEIKDIATLTVTGVIQDPKNSCMRVQFVVSNQIYDKFGMDIHTWNRLDYITFVMLQENADVKQLSAKTYGYLKKVWPSYKGRLILQPLKEVNLYSNLAYDPLRNSSIYVIYILISLGISILLIACINYMNLSTARSARRMIEVGLRKVVGAKKKQLIWQFLGESVLFALIALVIAFILVELALPHLNQLTLREAPLNRYFTPVMVLGLIGIALITGGVAGSYPAFFLSSFKPVTILKGPRQKGARGSLLRKILAIGQFSLSILLIIVTIILYKQLHYMQNVNLGYDKEKLVCIDMNAEIKKSYNSVKNELLKAAGIIDVTATDSFPVSGLMSCTFSGWEGRDTDKKIVLYQCVVDYDFFKTFKMDILQGRGFSRKFPSDLTSAVIVNEEAVKQMEMENPLGKHMSIWGKSKIIGVVKDFHFEYLRNKINPMVIKLAPQNTSHMIVRLLSGNIHDTLDVIKGQWKSFAPEYPFEFTFLDDRLNRMYFLEAIIGKVFWVFTGLAIFISCMGLFGLASFLTEQRTKEIGIRKVLGATVSGIIQLLSKEFLKWVLVANFIAWPIAFLLMSKFLQVYAYRAPMGIWPFLLAGVLGLLITLLSVGYQSTRAAAANPVEALRYE